LYNENKFHKKTADNNFTPLSSNNNSNSRSNSIIDIKQRYESNRNDIEQILEIVSPRNEDNDLDGLKEISQTKSIDFQSEGFKEISETKSMQNSENIKDAFKANLFNSFLSNGSRIKKSN